MARPPFGYEKEQGLCEVCGDFVSVPPGVYYRGIRLHKQCMMNRKQFDISNEVTEPYLNEVERELEELLDVPESST